MDNFKVKIKEVYLPYIVVSIGTIVSYNLLRWTFDIKLDSLPLKDDLLNFWVPFTLPWVPVLLWLRPRLRILKMKWRNDNSSFFYQFIMVLSIAIPTIFSQEYIEKASFGLVAVSDVTVIPQLPKEKYFDIRSFQVKKNPCESHVTSRTSGKYNANLNFYLYLSCPFEGTKNMWYGIEYKRGLSNRASNEAKSYEYANFLEESQKEFKMLNFQGVSYFEKLGNSDAKDGFLEAIRMNNPDIDTKEQIILIPRIKDFEQRIATAFPWIFYSFGIGALLLFVMIMIPKINTGALKHLKKKKPLKNGDLKDILVFINPLGPYQPIAILILLNLVVFLIMVLMGLNIMSPTPKELLEIGGNRRLEVLNGEYWRLITSLFIHAGISHLFMNLVSLSFAALILKNVLGKIKLLTSFVVCGILASVSSIFWYENTVSVGASGAIFGLYGIILAFTIFNIYPSNERRLNWILLGLFAGLSLLFGFFVGADNAAHLGGLASGFLLGVLFMLLDKEELIENLK